MKQHIKLDQIFELSKENIQKLKRKWKPNVGDLFVGYEDGYWFAENGYSEYKPETMCVSGSGNGYWFDMNTGKLITTVGDDADIEIDIKNTYPLLSIGQMIEILDREDDYLEILVGCYACEKEQLCDYLWEKVKETIKESK